MASETPYSPLIAAEILRAIQRSHDEVWPILEPGDIGGRDEQYSLLGWCRAIDPDSATYYTIKLESICDGPVSDYNGLHSPQQVCDRWQELGAEVGYTQPGPLLFLPNGTTRQALLRVRFVPAVCWCTEPTPGSNKCCSACKGHLSPTTPDERR